MSLLGLFKLKDSTTEQILFRNIDKKQFMNMLSDVTDQSTSTGFLSGGKNFHGLLEEDRFRLIRNQTLMSGFFVIKGTITTKHQDLIVEVEYKRGFMLTLMPTLVFVMSIFFLIDVIRSGNLDFRYYPFIVVCGLLVFWGLDLKRKNEIEKIKKLFRSSVDENAR
jgi:hypothetical protein